MINGVQVGGHELYIPQRAYDHSSFSEWIN